jgi:excisionase family DNA binding protein
VREDAGVTVEATNERLLTARELADMLGVSTETVLRWWRRGELPGIKLPGGAVRFRQSDIDRWLEQRARGVATSQIVPAGPG